MPTIVKNVSFYTISGSQIMDLFLLLLLLKAARASELLVVFTLQHHTPVDPGKKYHHIYEDYTSFAQADISKKILVNADTGYMIIGSNKLVIIYSGDGSVISPFVIEQVMIHNVASFVENSAVTLQFYSWLQKTIIMACKDCRNIQPTHPDYLSQVGPKASPERCLMMRWFVWIMMSFDYQIKDIMVLEDQYMMKYEGSGQIPL
ncbi:hypothetical protein FISHEDRAFT_59573 [Fistulina hepatica ATCC 64428]|uniref:Uncharacterized protein n=1 Tax=Fistulina hepatica ATCC 64428 TaxID=1128425 RepID=A0A0D7AA95_9AGAR|nr:hypothetical protein FISHEDRAFT_59573 [Fistulina hepatica ATCC 64428]